MKKRIGSILLVLVLLMQVVPVSANSSDKMVANIVKNQLSGNEYEFEMKYEINNAKKGEIYTIVTPFPINIKGGDFLKVSGSDGKYTLTAKDDFKVIRGSLGGTKTVTKDTVLNNVTINGKAIPVDYPDFSEVTGGNNGGSGERSKFYKLGKINEDGENIDWQIFITAQDNHSEYNPLRFEDQIGDNHSLKKETIKFQYIRENVGTFNVINNNAIRGNDPEDIVFQNVITDVHYIDDNYFTFDIMNLGVSDILGITYQTKIDKDQKEYLNQAQVGGKDKIVSKVTIKDWSDIDGENPDPKPDTKSIKVTKVWLDHEDKEIEDLSGKEVTLELLANDIFEREIILNTTTGWSTTIKDLPVKDKDGEEIKYTVIETSKHKDFTVSYKVTEDEVIVTNKEEKPEKPILPQVGEGLLKWQYILALCLALIAFTLNKKSKAS